MILGFRDYLCDLWFREYVGNLLFKLRLFDVKFGGCYIEKFEDIGVYDYDLALSYESIFIDFRPMISIRICYSRMLRSK